MGETDKKDKILEQLAPPEGIPPLFLEVVPSGKSHGVPVCDASVRHLCFAAAGKILSDPEVEAVLMAANTLVHPLDTFVIGAGKSVTGESKILFNMITKDVDLYFVQLLANCY